MATTTVKRLQIKGLSKYGFFAEGFEKGLYFSKNCKDKAMVVPGAEFDAEVYTSDAGANYLNKVVASKVVLNDGTILKAPAVSSKEFIDVEAAKHNTPKEVRETTAVFKPAYKKTEAATNGSATMSKEEWKMKDRSQLIGGLSHDAAQLSLASVTAGVPLAEVLTLYKAILEGVIKIRDEMK